MPKIPFRQLDPSGATEGQVARYDGYDWIPSLKHNIDSVDDPGLNDDSSAGYEPGSRWLNTTDDLEFVCLDASVGAAVWKETSGGQAVYAELFENGVGTGITITTAGTYFQWVSSTVGDETGAPWITGSVASDDITIGADGSGPYLVSFDVTVQGPNNAAVEAAVHVNGSIQNDVAAGVGISGATADHLLTAQGILVLASTDTIDLRFTSSTNSDVVTVMKVNLHAVRIAGTQSGGGVPDGMEIKDDGVSLGTGKFRLDFQGAGASVAQDGGDSNQINIFIPTARTVTIDAWNNTGGTLTRGTVVYQSGYNVSEDLPEVTAAQANALATAQILGVVETDFLDGSEGNIILSGQVVNFDTSGLTEGSWVYLSASVAGGLTATKPAGASTSLIVPLGVCIRSDVSVGDVRLYGQAEDSFRQPGGAPVNVTKAAAAAGSSTDFARDDHKHDIDTAAAVELTDSTNAEGSATSLARADHTHSHGSRGGGTLHAITSSSAAGFQPQSNLNSSANPTTTDDTSAGYEPGSRWVNTTLDSEFVCLDATASAAVWKETTASAGGGGAPASFIAEATATITTTSSTDVLMTSMTLTPAAGTYAVWFTGSLAQNGSNNNIQTSIYSGGAQVAASEREYRRGGGQGQVDSSFACVARVTVNGAEAIEGQWRTNAGTATAYERTLLIIEVS